VEIAYSLIAALAFCTAVACTLRARGALLAWIALLATAFFILNTGVEAFGWDGKTYRDFLCFWEAGRDVRAGREAYSESVAHNCPIYNPPTILPLLGALASSSAAHSYALWTTLCGLMTIALMPACRKALAGDKCPAVQGLDTATILILTAAVAMSNAARSNLINGQMGILVGFALVLAYWGRDAAKPFLTAVALTLATIKINLMLPFGLLFLRRRDRPILIWLPLLVLAVCISTARVEDQWPRVKTIAGGIEHSTTEGQVNDYSRSGPHPADMLGFDKLFYHLGVSDRSLIRVFQFAALFVLGLSLTIVALRSRTPPGLLASLLALYAVIFLYHRNYDTVILALPLAFSVGHARTSQTGARWWMTAAALAILAIIYLPRKALFLLMHHTFSSPIVSAFVEYVVLPSATWLILVSMACLWFGGRSLATQGAGADSICS
jgi:hypothetical protein